MYFLICTLSTNMKTASLQVKTAATNKINKTMLIILMRHHRCLWSGSRGTQHKANSPQVPLEHFQLLWCQGSLLQAISLIGARLGITPWGSDATNTITWYVPTTSHSVPRRKNKKQGTYKKHSVLLIALHSCMH